MRHLYIAAAVICFALPGAFGSAALAQSAGDPVGPLSDLVGARAGQAEGQVTDRGYTWVKTDKEGNSSYSYWTEKGSGNCVTIRTEEGRYQSIAYAAKLDCQAQTAAAQSAPAPTGAESHCKLYNNKSNNYKYDGNCEVNYNSSGDVYDVTLGNGDRYNFAGKGGKYKVTTPEGPSDNKASKLASGGNTVFDWYKWQLIISQ